MAGGLALALLVLFGASFGIWARPPHVPWQDDPFVLCARGGRRRLAVLLVRAMAGVVYKRTLNMCATMLIACAGAAIGDFWEAAAIVFFFALSEWLQEWCVHHTVAQTPARRLLPQTVELPGGGEKPLDDVAIGDVLVVAGRPRPRRRRQRRRRLLRRRVDAKRRACRCRSESEQRSRPAPPTGRRDPGPRHRAPRRLLGGAALDARRQPARVSSYSSAFEVYTGVGKLALLLALVPLSWCVDADADADGGDG